MLMVGTLAFLHRPIHARHCFKFALKHICSGRSKAHKHGEDIKHDAHQQRWTGRALQWHTCVAL